MTRAKRLTLGGALFKIAFFKIGVMLITHYHFKAKWQDTNLSGRVHQDCVLDRECYAVVAKDPL